MRAPLLLIVAASQYTKAQLTPGCYHDHACFFTCPAGYLHAASELLSCTDVCCPLAPVLPVAPVVGYAAPVVHPLLAVPVVHTPVVAVPAAQHTLLQPGYHLAPTVQHTVQHTVHHTVHHTSGEYAHAHAHAQAHAHAAAAPAYRYHHLVEEPAGLPPPRDPLLLVLAGAAFALTLTLWYALHRRALRTARHEAHELSLL